MAMLSATATRTASRMANKILVQRFGQRRSPELPNCREAAKVANSNNESRVEADRRFLQTVLQVREGTRWQEGTFTRLTWLLERIEPGSRARLVRSIRSGKATSEAWRVRSKTEWMETSPNPIELRYIDRWLSPAIKRQLKEFEKWAEDLTHEEWRIALAKQRILSPLTWFPRTHGLERGWHELKEKEQEDLIKHSILLQKIMLRVGPSHLRAIERFPSDDSDPEMELVKEIADVPPEDEPELEEQVVLEWMYASQGEWVGVQADSGSKASAHFGGEVGELDVPVPSTKVPASTHLSRGANPTCKECGSHLLFDFDEIGQVVEWCPKGHAPD